MRSHFPELSREDALKELASFVADLDKDRDRLEWAPGLLTILQEFIAEASKQPLDSQRLEILQRDVHAYFERYKFLKGICFVREWVDMVYEAGIERKSV